MQDIRNLVGENVVPTQNKLENEGRTNSKYGTIVMSTIKNIIKAVCGALNEKEDEIVR